jgi:hypothetical protein
MGELPPLTPRPYAIQKPIHNVFLAMLGSTATPIAGLKVMRNLLPFPDC